MGRNNIQKVRNTDTNYSFKQCRLHSEAPLGKRKIQKKRSHSNLGGKDTQNSPLLLKIKCITISQKSVPFETNLLK